MNFHVLTLFPDMIRDGFQTSITGRAVEKGLLSLDTVNIRDFSVNKHNRVDDYPYGGGAGMVMQAEPVYLAYQSVAEKLPKKPKVLYMSPQGKVFNQRWQKNWHRRRKLSSCAVIMKVLMNVFLRRSLQTTCPLEIMC